MSYIPPHHYFNGTVQNQSLRLLPTLMATPKRNRLRVMVFRPEVEGYDLGVLQLSVNALYLALPVRLYWNQVQQLVFRLLLVLVGIFLMLLPLFMH